MPNHHVLKVVQPYFGALLDGSKTFEVRRNDRAFQTGDTLMLFEFDSRRCAVHSMYCTPDNCSAYGRYIYRDVTYVYSGDPRFTGIEAGHVVLGLGVPVGEVPAPEDASSVENAVDFARFDVLEQIPEIGDDDCPATHPSDGQLEERNHG